MSDTDFVMGMLSTGIDSLVDGECRRCGQPVLEWGGRTAHRGAQGVPMVGCRAASYTTENGWNDDLPRSWKAARVTSG